jgi:hypothetical protein
MSNDEPVIPVQFQIYRIRQSINKVFGISESLSSCSSPATNNSSHSSAQASSHSSLEAVSHTSKKKKRSNNEKTRPVLVWNCEKDVVTVLCFATFGGNDPNNENPQYGIVYPQLRRPELLKYLVAVHPSAAVPDRTTISFITPSSGGSLDPTRKHYVVLITTEVKTNTKWLGPVKETLSEAHLEYLTELVFELEKEKHKSLIRNRLIPAVENHEKSNETQNSTASTTSSMPQKFRCQNGSIDNNDYGTYDDGSDDTDDSDDGSAVDQFIRLRATVPKKEMVKRWLRECSTNSDNSSDDE